MGHSLKDTFSALHTAVSCAASVPPSTGLMYSRHKLHGSTVTGLRRAPSSLR
jgi:hypothetical protein